MPLMMCFRRWWAAIFIAILCFPTIGLLTPDMPAPMRTVLEPQERWWEHASQRLDPYINNMFGFRGAFLAAHRSYVRFIGDPQNERVLQGENGTLFIRDDKALEQSLGELVRPAEIQGFITVASLLEQDMAAHGGRFVVVIPPNGHTTNFEDLPDYARRLKKAPTEYDLTAEKAKTAGITFVDMRPLLAQAKKSGPVHWKYDTHWNERGALLGFNAAMVAAGRPDLEVTESEALGMPTAKLDGDLLRLSGKPAKGIADISYPMKGPMAPVAGLTPIPGIAVVPRRKSDVFDAFAYTTGHAGPRIAVLGDSFTAHMWPGLLATSSSAFAWMPHRWCGFDLGAIERFRPDILIYAVTERYIPCRMQPSVWQPEPGAAPAPVP